jgi:ATP-dependent protease ClpP protease subunit
MIKKIILLILLSCTSCYVFSATFKTMKNRILLQGPIVTGDYSKLMTLLADQKMLDDMVFGGIELDSPGGSVLESLRIANFVQTSYNKTYVGPGMKCMSSCFLIWIAGASRYMHPQGVLGVHRISLSGNEINLAKTEATLKPINNGVAKFLEDNGTPRVIVDKMNETPASDIFTINTDWISDSAIPQATLDFRPVFIDVAEKKCGKYPYSTWERTKVRPSQADFSNWNDCSEDIRLENLRLNGFKVFELIMNR